MALPEDFDPSNPQSRSEDYLATALGYWDGELPEPQSRMEAYLKEIAENGTGSGGGILVASVDQTSTALPTTRPDGSPLENEDYVKPKAGAEYPFTVGGITFDNKFTKALYFNGEWIVDAGMIQDTSETPLKNGTSESLDEDNPAKNQKEINTTVKEAIRYLQKKVKPTFRLEISCPTAPDKYIPVDDHNGVIEHDVSTPLHFYYGVSGIPNKIDKIQLHLYGHAPLDEHTNIPDDFGEFHYDKNISLEAGDPDNRFFVVCHDVLGNVYRSDYFYIDAQKVPKYRSSTTPGSDLIKCKINKDYQFTGVISVGTATMNGYIYIQVPKGYPDAKIFSSKDGHLAEDYTDIFSKSSYTEFDQYMMRRFCAVDNFEFTICLK